MQYITDMPEAEYHAHPAISCSQLKLIHSKTPAHYHYEYVLGNRKESDALNFGSAAHMALLEPERFSKEYAVAPDVNFSTRKGCVEYLEWMCEVTGTLYVPADDTKLPEIKKQIAEMRKAFTGHLITQSDADRIAGMVAAINANPMARHILTQQGQRETSLFFEIEGVECRARLDVLADIGLVTDYKTTTDASPEGFQRNAFNYGYYMQAWFYREAVRQCFGKEWPFAFIAQEKEPPYAVGIYQADDEMLTLGEQHCLAALHRLNACRQENHYPAYPAQIMALGLPGWVQNKINYGEI